MTSARTLPNAAHSAFNALESSDKPVIAAVNGPALGGGNELVLACNYVVAAEHARFGQPEINLHLLPGYGGTQRLPRRLHAACGEQGVIEALRMMISGRAIDAGVAAELGLVDELVAPSGQGAVASAVTLVRRYLQGEGPLIGLMAARSEARDLREQPLELPDEHLQDKRLIEAVEQARAGGRQQSVDRILGRVLHGRQAWTIGRSRKGSAPLYRSSLQCR